MKPISIETQDILNSLKKAVNNALEKKKRLGQYAVIWNEEKPVIEDYSFPQIYFLYFTGKPLGYVLAAEIMSRVRLK